jgi:hypothetical protein
VLVEVVEEDKVALPLREVEVVGVLLVLVGFFTLTLLEIV